MKNKPPRQLARELGVSASYLSQVKNGKKRAIESLLTKIDFLVLTNQVNTRPMKELIISERKVYNSEVAAEVAQVVEQRTENPRVNSSTLFLGTTHSLGSLPVWLCSAAFPRLFSAGEVVVNLTGIRRRVF
jgi:transcriptional regulator with XRE-family HTH domain